MFLRVKRREVGSDGPPVGGPVHNGRASPPEPTQEQNRDSSMRDPSRRSHTNSVTMRRRSILLRHAGKAITCRPSTNRPHLQAQSRTEPAGNRFAIARAITRAIGTGTPFPTALYFSATDKDRSKSRGKPCNSQKSGQPRRSELPPSVANAIRSGLPTGATRTGTITDPFKEPN